MTRSLAEDRLRAWASRDSRICSACEAARTLAPVSSCDCWRKAPRMASILLMTSSEAWRSMSACSFRESDICENSASVLALAG